MMGQETVTPTIQQTNPSMTIIPTGQDMMGNGNTMNATPSMSMKDQQDITTGSTLFNQFKNNQITCQNLQNDDLEKIGEYVMNQQMGNAMHMQTNQMFVQMMGSNGEEQMHILIGRNSTGCIQISPIPMANNNSSLISGISRIKDRAGWIVAGILFLIDVVIFLVWLLKPKYKKNLPVPQVTLPPAPPVTSSSPTNN